MFYHRQTLSSPRINAARTQSIVGFVRLCVSIAICVTSMSSVVRGTTFSLSQDLLSLGAGVTAPNSPYINAGYDLYSTTTPTDNSMRRSDGDGYFAAGTRLSSLPSFVTVITTAGADSSAAGFQGVYSVIASPAGGTVQAGLTYNITPAISDEQDLLKIFIGNGVPSNFYIGALINISGDPADDDDDVRLRQTAGGSANSGLISTRNTNYGSVDLVLFQITGAAPGDIYTVSGVENRRSSSSGNYSPSLAGLTFSTAVVPEPTSTCLFLLALVGITLGYGVKRFHRPSSS